MPIAKFVGGSYVKHYHCGVCDEFCKPSYINIFIVLLATCCRHA